VVWVTSSFVVFIFHPFPCLPECGLRSVRDFARNVTRKRERYREIGTYSIQESFRFSGYFSESARDSRMRSNRWNHFQQKSYGFLSPSVRKCDLFLRADVRICLMYRRIEFIFRSLLFPLSHLIARIDARHENSTLPRESFRSCQRRLRSV